MPDLYCGPRGHRSGRASQVAPPRIAALDGVRGLAILLVLLDHYGKSLLDPARSAIDRVLAQGLSMTFAGVDLFFVLSGFLIGGILLRNKSADNFFGVFYTRRAARLLPPYLLVLAAFMLMAPSLKASGTEAGRWLAVGFGEVPMWSYFAYLQNIFMAIDGGGGGQWLAVTWSLAIEEQFYLLAPLLVWLLPDRYLPRVLIGLILTAPLLRTALVLTGDDAIPPYVLLPCRWDSLCIGILAAYCTEQPHLARWLREHPGEIVQRLWLGLAAVVLMAGIGIKAHTIPMLTLGHTALALFGCAIILAALYVERPWLQAVLCNPGLRWLGGVSYGVYLLHEPMLGLAAHFTIAKMPRYGSLAEAGVVLLALTATLVLAALSMRYLEKPILAAAHRLRYRTTPAANPLDAPASAARPA